ncbi:DUF3072 domain-containing protein [Pelagibacterium sp.]|uniref:DUF3072 domain-containing protein n=1 Tax=Pelagibacterium sp. TaxID=1967288 RepID=UPI0032FFD307
MSDLHPGIATANPDAFRVNDHEDYDSGEGPMSVSQAAELLCLSQRAEEPDAYADDLTSIEAANRIRLLKRKLDG